jgi:hypothetical protein
MCDGAEAGRPLQPLRRLPHLRAHLCPRHDYALLLIVETTVLYIEFIVDSNTDRYSPRNAASLLVFIGESSGT